MLNITAQQQAKATEKLSLGYRINRAATNAEDGVSAVQTAEGALLLLLF